MTLVVSEISDLGIVMVGDSAVTKIMRDGTKVPGPDAVKVQYSRRARVGFALWGNATVPTTPGPTRMDRWLASFMKRSVRKGQRLEEIGDLICRELNPLLEGMGRSWNSLNRGIHLAAYENGMPRLCHVHCGRFKPEDTAHELRFHPDSDNEREKWRIKKPLTPFPPYHFRNGMYSLFAYLSESIDKYANAIMTDPNLRIRFPRNTLESRLQYHKLLVTFIAGVLSVSGERPSVNSRLSAIAFDQNGIRVDQRRRISPTAVPRGSVFEIEY